MISYSLPFEATVHVYRPGEQDFGLWLERPRPYLAVDTETTGLDWADHLRLVQFGDTNQAWVLQADRDKDLIRQILEHLGRRFIG